MDKHISKRSANKNYIPKPPWFNVTAKEAMKHKNKVWLKYRKDKSSENWNNFTSARNSANMVITNRKGEFELLLANSIK